MNRTLWKVIVQFVGIFIALGAVLFLSAGTVKWVGAWIFIVLSFGFLLTVYLWMFKHDPELLQERTHILGKSDQQGWDKVLYLIFQIFAFAWLILISLDSARYHWSHLAFWLELLGMLILLCSFLLFFLTFRENTFLSPVVRNQQDRGQKVVSTGPYHRVRHPMYSAIIMFIIGTSLLLGSYYGLLFGLIDVIIIAVRAVLEERMLKIVLPGYDAYMRQVKYRFIPYVW